MLYEILELLDKDDSDLSEVSLGKDEFDDHEIYQETKKIVPAAKVKNLPVFIGRENHIDKSLVRFQDKPVPNPLGPSSIENPHPVRAPSPQSNILRTILPPSFSKMQLSSAICRPIQRN